jgi:hypothetical protein
LITTPIERLITDLAESPRVREFLRVASVRDAIKRIYIDGLPEPSIGNDELVGPQLQLLRPYILLYPSESDSYRIEQIAAPSCINMNGSIDAIFSRDYPSKKTPTEAWREIAGQIGECVYSSDPTKPGLLNYLGQADRLQIRELNVDMYGRTPFAERTDYGDAYDVVLTMRY